MREKTLVKIMPLGPLKNQSVKVVVHTPDLRPLAGPCPELAAFSSAMQDSKICPSPLRKHSIEA